MKFKSIAARIYASVIPTIVITTISFVMLNYYVSNSQINKTVNEKMYESLHSADLEIQLELYKNEAIALSFANYGQTLEQDAFSHEKHQRILEYGIKSNENTFGGGVWFEPYEFDSTSKFFGPFLYIDDVGEAVYVPDYGSVVDYFDEDWYVKGKNSNGEFVWSKVYFDPVSGKTMLTATKAFYDPDGKFIGVGTADMNIEKIQSIVSNISVGETGKAFIIGSGGEYISFFDEIKSINDTIQTDSDKELARLGNELMNNASGTSSLVRNGKKLRVYYLTMENVSWTLAATFEESEIAYSTISTFIIVTVIPILGLLLVIFGIFMVARYLRRIVSKVNKFAVLASSGDFSKRIDVIESDEFGFMEQRLNTMIANMADMSQNSAKSLELAKNASNSKSEFLSRMSHEIRTPMNAIIGMTQIAKSCNDTVKIKDCLGKVDAASKHLLALINDILDVSKIEANKLELAAEAFSLEQTITNIYNMMLVKAEEKNQRLEINVDNDVPTFIISDELRFFQVVTNLLGNAIKFTPENGNISVNVSELERATEYSVIMISIKDSGIGISKEQHSKLFKSFEQADGSISRKYGGTGLGLVISKSLVEMMGGSITVDSEFGKGSTFSFTIKVPRASDTDAENKLIQPNLDDTSLNSDMSAIDFSDKTILLVEDIDINREIVILFLEHTNIKIDIAENGIQAIEMFQKTPDKYDLILMDIQMPQMDGLEATKRIRQLNPERAKTIPIIAMTANALIDDIKISKAAGMNDHLTKPLEADIMLAMLNDYLLLRPEGDNG